MKKSRTFLRQRSWRWMISNIMNQSWDVWIWNRYIHFDLPIILIADERPSMSSIEGLEFLHWDEDDYYISHQINDKNRPHATPVSSVYFQRVVWSWSYRKEIEYLPSMKRTAVLRNLFTEQSDQFLLIFYVFFRPWRTNASGASFFWLRTNFWLRLILIWSWEENDTASRYIFHTNIFFICNNNNKEDPYNFCLCVFVCIHFSSIWLIRYN